MRLQHFVLWVSSLCLGTINGSNIYVPNDKFSRFLYTWEVIESQSYFMHIYAFPLNKTLSAISWNGSHFTFNGQTLNPTSPSNLGIAERIHSFNADFRVPLYCTESGKVYTLQHSSPDLIGRVDNINSVLIAKGHGTNNIELLAGVEAGFNPLQYMFTSVINATDVSCTFWNQTCWSLEGRNLIRYFRWQNASLDILATLSITEDDFVSITVHENELWLVTLDGLRAWRRLELSPQNPVGKRWMVFPLHLPHSIRMVTIGAAGIFALTQGGLVARFQGFESSVNPPNPLFQIDSYDEKDIFAITEEGKAVQSKGGSAIATAYGRLMRFNKTNKSWSFVFPEGQQLIKNVAVGESEVFVLKNGTDADVSTVDFLSNSIIKHGLDYLSVLELGAGADGVFYLIEDSPLDSRLLCQGTNGYFLTVNGVLSTTFHKLSSISCGKYQCWAIRSNGSSLYISINQSCPCSTQIPTNQHREYDEGIVLKKVDTDKSGLTAAIERDSGDVFVRFGVFNSSLEGAMWVNIPGTNLKDIAVGRGGIYGLDMRGNFRHFARKDGNWTNWAPWSHCSASCNNGTKWRVRFCNHPAPAYGGKNCTGDESEVKPCFEQNCTGHEWGTWSSWSSCNGSCPYGQMRRTRSCVEALNSQINNCVGSNEEVFNCPIQCTVTKTVFIEKGIRRSWQDAVKGLYCNGLSNVLTFRTTVKYMMLYFENMTIPKTATVLSALVQFTAKRSYFSSNLVADVSLVMDPWTATTADFTSCSFSAFGYSTRILWTASTTWASGDRGPAQQTPDFHQALQDFIGQAPWNGRGPIIVALRDMTSGKRDAYSYEGDPLKAASVLITYNETVPSTTFSTNWSSWSNWTLPCFAGVQNRVRTCMLLEQNVTIHSSYCNGFNFEQRYCSNNLSCDGIWSDWYLTEPCNVSCGVGNQTWERNCIHQSSSISLPSSLGNDLDAKTNSCIITACSSTPYSEWTSVMTTVEAQEMTASLASVKKSILISSTLDWLAISSTSVFNEDIRTTPSVIYSSKVTSMIELSTRDSMKSSLIKAEPQSSSSSLVLQVRSKPNTETLDESFSMAAAVSNDIKSSIAISGTLITGSSVLSTASESKTGVFHSEIDSVAQTPEKPASKTAHTKPTQATAVIQAAPSMNSSLYAQIALSSSLYEPIQTARIIDRKDGQSIWAFWGECSRTCGGGTKMRFRKCNENPGCSRNEWQSSVCMESPCPVNGGWTEWSLWSSCDQSCDGGWRFSKRACSNPVPQHGGLTCDGVATIQEECNLHICPVHGGWGQWTNWTLCDKPCSSGRRKRFRFCDSPEPKYGGAECRGESEQKRTCHEHACKIVSVKITAKFPDENFTAELQQMHSNASENLKAKISINVKAIYNTSSPILDIHSFKFREGSVIADFWLVYRELSTVEIIALATHLDEKKLLGTMRIGYWYMNYTEVPPPPENIATEVISSSVIRIHWNAPWLHHQNCTYNITGFVVAYKQFTDGDFENWQRHVATRTALYSDIKYLSPYLLYTFRVTAMTHVGLGIPSQYVDAYTTQGAPTKPPNDFDCQPESATSIFCEWGAIPQYHQRGELLYYQITYRPYGRGRISGSSYWQNITIHFTQRYHTIDDLEVFTRYEFEIQGCTMAGAGPVAWAQAKTHEGVPVSSPFNITIESFALENAIEVRWARFPPTHWQGKPFAINLHYKIIRRGPMLDLRAEMKQETLNFDQSCHRITGLGVNWALSIQLSAQTMAGEGPLSRKLSGETCHCHKNIYVSWYEKKPYISRYDSSRVTGIFPHLLDEIRRKVCGYCKRFDYPTIYYYRSKSGRYPVIKSTEDVRAEMSDDVHIHLPVTGDKIFTVLEGKFQYIQVYDYMSSVYITLDKAKAAKSRVMMQLLFKAYPILLIIALSNVATGIAIWLIDQCSNPEEFRKGHFLTGVLNGVWWAFITMTTVGYGDIIPRGCIGRLFSLVWMIVGLVLTSVFISTLTATTTASSIANNVVFYGRKVGALYGSKEYSLGIRRLADVITADGKGKNFTNSKEVLQALLNNEVEGALLETNEAGTLFDYISKNGLLVRKKIDSTKGIGFVLSGSMIQLHSEIRAYVKSNKDVLDSILKNATKPFEIQSITDSRDHLVTTSTIFKDSIWYSLTAMGSLLLFGCFWQICLRPFIKKVRRISPKTKEECIQAKYMADSEELIKFVDSFSFNHLNKMEELHEQQMKERFQLMISRNKATPYGPKGWLHYKTLNYKRILSEVRATELINESLYSRKAKKRTAKGTENHPMELYKPANIETQFEPIGFVLENIED